MKGKEFLPLILSIILLAGALFYAYTLSIPVDTFIRLDAILSPSLWMSILSLMVITLLGGYILSYVRDDRIFYGVWLLFIALSLILLLPSDEIDNVSFTALLITSVFSRKREVKGLLDVWYRVRSLKTFSSVVFFILLLWVVLPNIDYYNNLMIDSTLEIVNSFRLTPADASSIVDKLIVTELTDEDRQLILEYVQSLPEWNYLTPSQREELITRLENEFVQQKLLIKEMLQRSIRMENVTLDRETLERFLSSSPQLRAALDVLYIFLLLVALATFSLSSEVASLLLFFLLLIPEFIRLRYSNSHHSDSS